MAKKLKFDYKTMTGQMTGTEFINYIMREYAEANKTGDKERIEKATKLIEDATARLEKLARKRGVFN